MNSIKEWNNSLLYLDKFTLYDYEWIDDGNGLYQKQQEKPLIQQAPCYLSISKNALGNKRRLDQPDNETGDHDAVERVLMLFCDPEYTINAGHILEVEHCGDIFRGIAGQPHKYMWHQELLIYSIADA